MSDQGKIDSLYDVTPKFLGELRAWLEQMGFKANPPSGTGYSIIQEEGVNLPPQHVLDFIGANVTAANDPTNHRTTVTITSPTSTIAVKTSDTTRSSNTTLTNDPDLKFSIGTSNTESWLVECFLMVDAADTLMQFKMGWTYPTGVTMKWGGDAGYDRDLVAGWGAGAGNSTAIQPLKIQTDTVNYDVSNGTGAVGMSIKAIVFGGGTSGTVNFAWSQVTSDAGSLVLRKGSCLRAAKLAS